mmetsp:Transcript_58805/g.80253  ORF Transcript_58805/g.80253 Transcript_58805/m.80253 type:complete len:98 (-) Transcript_58805:881-1174(-)
MTHTLFCLILSQKLDSKKQKEALKKKRVSKSDHPSRQSSLEFFVLVVVHHAARRSLIGRRGDRGNIKTPCWSRTARLTWIGRRMPNFGWSRWSHCDY